MHIQGMGNSQEMEDLSNSLQNTPRASSEIRDGFSYSNSTPTHSISSLPPTSSTSGICPTMMEKMLDEILHEVSTYKSNNKIENMNLEKLKPEASVFINSLKDELEAFLRKRQEGVAPDLSLLKQTLIEYGILAAIHSKMEEQLDHLFIKLLLNVFANKYVAAAAGTFVLLLSGYTVISFSIAPFESQTATRVLVISGVVSVILFVIITIILGLMEQQLERLKLSEQDMIEIEFYNGFFKRLTTPIVDGDSKKLNFSGCLEFLDEFPSIRRIPFEIRDGLRQLANDCMVCERDPSVLQAASTLRRISEAPASHTFGDRTVIIRRGRGKLWRWVRNFRLRREEPVAHQSVNTSTKPLSDVVII